MDFLSSTISKALGSQQPTLLFTIGRLIEEKPQGSIWSLYSGTKKDDQQPVSVFIFDVQKCPEKVVLARNALKRAKTIRYPDCVKFIDGVETEQQIIIGTEQVESLVSNLSISNLDENLARLGLFKVASTIKFLSEDCQIIHGNIGIQSVFVTRSGEWKVGGFEVMHSIKEERSFLKIYGYLMPSENRLNAPELDMDRTVPTTAVDAWSFGCLIYNVFNGIKITSRSSLDNRAQIPISLFRHYGSLLHNDPVARLSIEKFLLFSSAPKGYFENNFVSTSLFLEQLALKDKLEKEQFLVNIEKSVGSFPINFCKFKILPELVQSLEFGGAGAKALKPILSIGSRLGAKEFEQLVTPAIVKLFNSNDRSIRLALCEKIDSFVNMISDQACNDTIYPNLATGFSDATPIIREQTLRAVSIIAPKLQKKTINNSLLRYLAKLQVDQEPGIRTNTTICIAKLSKYFDDSLKCKVLLQAFLRSLQDPFPFARKAGLMGIVATSDSFAVDDISRKFIPHVAPLLIDPESSIREQAFNTIDSLLKIVKIHSASMPSPSSAENDLNLNSKAEVEKEGEDWTSWAISAVSSGLARSNVTTASPDQSEPTLSTVSSESLSASKKSALKSVSKDLFIPQKSSSWENEGWNDDFSIGETLVESSNQNPISNAKIPTPASNGWEFDKTNNKSGNDSGWGFEETEGW